MADVNANIGVNIDTTQALAQLKSVTASDIAVSHRSIAKSSETAALAQRDLAEKLCQCVLILLALYSAELRTVRTHGRILY
jgi:hypothetical protein